jgi:outer membrane protein insertion porin family
MTKKIFIISLFYLLSTIKLFATEIYVEGNKRINEETIKVYGGIEKKDNYSNQDINKYLKNLYETDFFEDIQISFENKVLKIIVKEYKMVNSIILNGEPSEKIRKSVLKFMKSKEKEGFIESNLSKDLENITNAYQSLGFLLADIDIQKEILDENSLNLIIEINRGEKIKVKKINFIGDKKIKERRLRDIIVTTEDKFWKVISKNTVFSENNVRMDKRLLENFYKSVGYYDVNVVSSNATFKETGIELTYNIDAGNRYKISKFSTNIDPALNKEFFTDIKKIYDKYLGDYYSPFKVKKVLEELDLLIADNDLQFIEHSVNEIINEDEIEIKVNVFESAKISVERIEVVGNNITNESVIRGELLLDEGDPFSKLKLDQSIAKLKSRDIFAKVEADTTQGKSTNTKSVTIEVEEKATGEISAGAGIGSDGGSFAFSVSENNWMGKGVQVQTSVEVNATSLKGEIAYTDSNYNNSGNLLRYGLSSSQNDMPDSGFENSIISANIGTGYEQFKNIYFNPGLTVTSDKLTVLDTASNNLKKQAGTYTDLSVDYSFSKDTRNRAFMPTSGSVAYFKQVLPVYADAASIRNSVSYSGYKELNENVVGAFKIFGSAITGLDEDVRLSKRLYASNRKLRGFQSGKVGPKDNIDYVGGNYLTTMNFEATLPNLLPESTKTEIGTFLDFGNVWGVDYDSSVDESNKIRSSAGATASWLSPLGPMTFVFSRNIAKADTDKTESFKFQLGTTF